MEWKLYNTIVLKYTASSSFYFNRHFPSPCIYQIHSDTDKYISPTVSLLTIKAVYVFSWFEAASMTLYEISWLGRRYRPPPPALGSELPASIITSTNGTIYIHWKKTQENTCTMSY